MSRGGQLSLFYSTRSNTDFFLLGRMIVSNSKYDLMWTLAMLMTP